jgi:hypothetical protein
MVVEMTKGKKRPMIFLTAPPEIKQTACLRFRVPRNLPYRDAPPYKSSIYYWWWAFLKRDQNYADTCASRGRGHSAKLYKDFGNVFKSDFLTWWRCHQGLFAEQSAAEDHKILCDTESRIWYQIDPKRPFNQIYEEIRALHLQAHAIMPKKRASPSSTAQYPVYANVSAHTLYRVLAIWDLRSANPEASAYELGVLAGYKANLIPTSKFGETRTRRALDAQLHNKRVRVSIANKANRYLRTAAQYIKNVGRGEFPKAQNR